MHNVIVIGAGIGGLTTAALLARAGLNVTVLEAHIYPGGCAGTFYHQGYRFDAGATLAGGFYPGGPMDMIAQAVGIERWPADPAPHTMRVHLPDGQTIDRYGDERRHAERERAFGAQGRRFFDWQERTADALWALALRNPPWPPQTVGDAARLLGAGLGWLAEDITRLRPALLADALRPVAAHLHGASPALRTFIDTQLLIAAQTTGGYANALYGAAALDLPRRGPAHIRGGIGAVAATLAEAVERHGGRVLYRRPVTRIRVENGRPVGVEVTGRRSGRVEIFDADLVIANLTPWNVARLLADPPRKLRALPRQPQTGWGAAMAYVGLDAGAIPPDTPLHQQVVDTWDAGHIGEGRTVFLSLSPADDASRAPAGKRALTLSTHTNFRRWWRLIDADPDAYEREKQHLSQRMLAAAERAIPGLRAAADLVLPGTPVTFQTYTRRAWGWVGGFPQENLTSAWGPRLQPGLWLVGDSIFPGQSVPAVALGGLRVAETILQGAVQHDLSRQHLVEHTF